MNTSWLTLQSLMYSLQSSVRYIFFVFANEFEANGALGSAVCVNIR